MTGLEQQLHESLPKLSFRARSILDALLLHGGPIGSEAEVAERVGLSSRFALGRMMRREGLPALPELAAWISVLSWIRNLEHSKVSLFALATHCGKSPATCYRVVRRLTGLTWTELKARGCCWALCLFLDRCQTIDLPSREVGKPLVYAPRSSVDDNVPAYGSDTRKHRAIHFRTHLE